MVWSLAQSLSENSPSWIPEANSLSVAGVNQKGSVAPEQWFSTLAGIRDSLESCLIHIAELHPQGI